MSCGFLAQKAKLIYAIRRLQHYIPPRYIYQCTCIAPLHVDRYWNTFLYLNFSKGDVAGGGGGRECKRRKRERKPASVEAKCFFCPNHVPIGTENNKSFCVASNLSQNELNKG